MTVVKRDTKSGTVYGVVNRVKDPATGISRAKWMGTYPTAEEAKIADGEALKQRRSGTYTPPVPADVRRVPDGAGWRASTLPWREGP